MNLVHLTRCSASCLTAALLLALAGTAGAQSAPTPPAPPDTPIHTTTSISSSWTMSQSDNGRTVTVSSKDGKLSAEIDGKAVPEDRIIQKGSTVRIKDDQGQTVFESEVPGANPVSRYSYRLGTSAPRAIKLSPHAGGKGMGSDSTIRIAGEPPKVMVGVQLLEPDSSLRGHLGLKEDESTLISAVYEGLPAAQAGLEPYDIVVGINGKTPAPPETVRKALRETDAGKAVSLDIIHRGQKKTVSITVEKYDADKLEKSKIDAIAAVSGAPTAIAGMPGDDANAPLAWSWGHAGGNPFVATLPGQPGQPNRSITLWGRGGADQEEMAKRLEELADRAKQQADLSQEQAQRLHDQLMNLGGPGAQSMLDMNKLMEERMRKMEEMMQKMMEQHNNATPAPTPKKDENKS
jgi:hypothetical protein